MVKSPKPSGKRTLKTRVKTARKRSTSSTRWLQRQLNDPYVSRAKKEGYRSRAAYKLIELDDKYKWLKPGKLVLDLMAPRRAEVGRRWRCRAVRSTPSEPKVIGVDLLPMQPVAGALLLKLDFMHGAALAEIRAHLKDGVDVVLSDMAPNTTGHAATDHARIMAILEAVYPFASQVLKPGGVFVAKVFQGGTEQELLTRMKKDFASVKHAKPNASRSDSSEMYVVATGFKSKR